MGRPDDYEQGRQRFEARPARERRSASLLLAAAVAAFFGLMSIGGEGIGWTVGLFALAGVLAVPGLVGLVLSDH